MSKSKILFIVSSLGIGGAQRQTVEIAGAMAERGFDAVFLNLAIRDDEDLLKHIAPGIKVRKLKRFSKLSGGGMFSSFVSSLYAAYKTAQAVKRERADIIYARQWSAKFPAAIAGALLGIRDKTVLAEASNSEYEIKRKRVSALSKKLIFFARKMTYQIAGTVVANSGGLAEKTARYFGIEGKILTVKNGINTKKIRSESAEAASHPYFGQGIPVVVSVGRLDAQKDFATLIKSIAIAGSKIPVRLVIIGGGRLEGSLKKLAEEHGIAENVSFIGAKENPHKYTARCDIFACSSTYEGFSGAILEAAALGMPIVSTRHPFGANEIIEDGKSGLLVPVGDAKAMADAIVKLLENKTLAEEMGKSAREKAENFHIEKMIAEYEKLFAEIVNTMRAG